MNQSDPSTNKVKTRSKTSSIKRPFSCHVNELNNKELKGPLCNMRKSSSNSRLNEDADDSIQINDSDKSNDEAKQAKIVERMPGRNFDSDEDFDLLNEETSVTKMDKIFDDCDKVINDPALIGYLLKYLMFHNMDYYNLLYYLVVQHYKVTIQLKEFSKEAQRFANEILTTFVHDKSNLRIDHEVDMSKILDDLNQNKNLLNLFDNSSEEIYKDSIQNSINRLRQSITHGLFSLDISVGSLNFDSKMNFFNECIKNIIKSLEEKVSKETNNTATQETKEKENCLLDVISGVKTSLATIYYYFSKKEKDDNADNISILSSRYRTSFLGKSTESLQIMTNCVLDKQPIFCSKLHKKPTTHSFFKKPKSIKGHNFQEKIFEYPALCLFCEKLLWGINPQGLFCSGCQEAVHRNCKDDVRTNCSKEPRRFHRNPSSVSQAAKDDTSKLGYPDEDTISVNSQKSSNNNNYRKDSHDHKDVFENESSSNIADVDQVSEAFVSPSIYSEMLTSTKSNNFVSTATIYVSNNGEKLSQNIDTASMERVSDNSHGQQNEHSKVYDELKKNGYEDTSHVRNVARKFDENSIPRSQSEDSMENKTIPRINKRTSVFVQDLVPDSSMWTNDPDMCVEESFEANKELEYFPLRVTKEEDKAEYTRLLVLMEFHHKIKFTAMTLKRFDYLLIRQWPNDDTFLFKTLSLNRIIPLYELIKTLNSTIEQSKTSVSYSKDMACNVHDWLVSNEESNLQEWLKYSIDLCCTNSLNLVKNTWKEYYRTDGRFSKVLNKKYNKMIMVEQLSNMRPLLFNLPLIVCKIYKDLNKFSKFKDETKIWKDIYEKFKKLPTFIDEHCMPLVQLINNGTIVNSLDRNTWISRLSCSDPFYDYIIDFPKTAFNYKIFDFQEIKLSNFRESGNKDKTPAVFVRESSDAYAICYDTMLVLLQKDNEKYHLKIFKAADNLKMSPILMLENVHASKGENKGEFFELTLVFINVAVLAQILFQKKDVWNRWFYFIFPMKSRVLKNKTEIPEIDVNKYAEIRAKFQEFSVSHSLFFKEDIKLTEYDDKNVVFQIPNDSNELIIGTTFDAINVLKTCYENLSVLINDEALDHLVSLLSVMDSRISNYKSSRTKNILNTDDIDLDLPRDEPRDTILQITPSESLAVVSGDNSEEEFHFVDLKSHDVIDPADSVTENEILNMEDTLFDIDESSYHKDILLFVEEYVNQIIDDAWREVNDSSPHETDSDVHQDVISLIEIPSTISDVSA